MKVSVVVNNFNYARYLEACLDSVLQQTYESVEVIVVDDGSTDNSREIIANYKEKVFFLEKENGGQGSALNAGYAASTGQLVLFLDSDDMLAPNCIMRCVEMWTIDSVMLHYNMEFIDSFGSLTGQYYHSKVMEGGDIRDLVLKKGSFASTPMSGNLFSASFLQRVMPMTASMWRRAADAYLFNTAPLYGKIIAINEPLARYRIHDSNMSSHFTSAGFSKEKCKSSIDREINTDNLIYKHAQITGKNYQPGTLLKCASHLQQVLVYNKINYPFLSTRPFVTYINFTRVYVFESDDFYFKKYLILIWLAAIVALPKPLAIKLIEWGYKQGGMLFLRRPKKSRLSLSAMF